MDPTTYIGCIRALIFFSGSMYLLLHTYELSDWVHNLLGIPHEIDPGKQSWARLWAIVIGGMGIAGSILGIIMIPIKRRRASESAQGQWYDRPNLTREELLSDETIHEERDREQQ